MARSDEFWTPRRIKRLEHVLWNHRGDVTAGALHARLIQAQTPDQKRELIIQDLVPTLKYQDGVMVWEGREISTRVILRDVIQAFLHEEGIAENVPTNEPDTPAESAERERLARLFSTGKSAADMVIEDRGPR